MQHWYSGATRGQWLALAAALLGWAFDGFEMGVFPMVSRPALFELLGRFDDYEKLQQKEMSGEERLAAQMAVREVEPIVQRWNAVIYAAFLFGAAAGGFVFGWIGDRVGRVRAMIFSVLTYALFSGFCGLVTAPWQFVVLRFIAALGMGGEWSLGVALVMESWSAHARPVLAGLIGASANLGYLFVGVIAKVFTPDEWWRLLMILCVVPAFLTFLLRTFVPESKRWEHAASSGPRARFGDIFVPSLRSHTLMGAAIGAVALLATWGGIQMIPQWIGQLAPELKDAKVNAQIASSLGAVIGSFLAAVVGYRFSRRLVYLGLCALSLVVGEFLFFGHAEGPFNWPLLGLILVAGMCSASFYGWLPLYLPELFPTRVRATGQGFCFNIGRTLAAVGVLLTTFAIDVGGRYAQAAALACLIYVVGIVLAFFIPETRGQPLPD